MITIEINGRRFEGFENIQVSKNIETISGSFVFFATSNDLTKFPIKRSDSCKIFINDEAVINGFVDSIEVNYDSQSHSIVIQGRDRTSDIIDSTLIGNKEFTAPTSLETIIRTVLDENGLTEIPIVNNAGTIEDFPENTRYSSSIGQTVFEFIELYARKRQVLLTTNGNGDLVIARSGSILSKMILENKINGVTNNIKSATIIYTSDTLFNKYITRSQLDPAALSFGTGDTTLSNIVDQEGEAIDNSIRESRQMEIPSGSSDDNVDLTNLAIWNKNIRRARSTDFSVIVRGFHQDIDETILWKINELVKVNDDFSDINSTLLIKSVEYNLDLDTGSTTTLQLVNPSVYTLQAQIDEATARSNDEGENLVFGI